MLFLLPLRGLTAALALWLVFCLCGGGAARASSDSPVCSDGRQLLIPAAEKSQVAQIFEGLAPLWQGKTGSSLRISHHPGRGGSYALRDLLLEKANGCTFAGVVLPSFFYQIADPDSMIGKDEISLCAVAAQAHNALWVAADSPFRNWQEFLAHARHLAQDPAALLLVAGTGRYSDQHMATLQLNRAAGIKTQYSPFLGSVEAAQAVRSGAALAFWAYALNPDDMPDMRPLALAAETRSSLMPDTPTFKEMGVDCTSAACFGLALPAALSQKQQKALHKALVLDTAAQSGAAVPGLEILTIRADSLPIFVNQFAVRAEADLDEYPMLPALSLFPAFP